MIYYYFLQPCCFYHLCNVYFFSIVTNYFTYLFCFLHPRSSKYLFLLHHFLKDDHNFVILNYVKVFTNNSSCSSCSFSWLVPNINKHISFKKRRALAQKQSYLISIIAKERKKPQDSLKLTNFIEFFFPFLISTTLPSNHFL